MGLADQTSLEHVRLRGAGGEASVARLRLSSLLASASLQPTAMPPSAVLVVRSMADPLPGRIAGELQAAATVSREWERAAQDRLGALYARAARPAWGAVSSSAEAVLFADYGELLACLANDLSSGAAAGWWWQSILKRYSVRLPGSWSSLWEGRAQYIPSALEYLVSRNRATAVLERIAPVQAWRLLLATVRVFDLPDSVIPRDGTPAIARTGGGPAHPKAAEPRAPAGQQYPAGPHAHGSANESADFAGPPGRRPLPWEPHVPPDVTPVSLGIERRALLGLGLLLSRAPARALSPGFAWRFAEWLGAPEGAVGESSPPPTAPPRGAEPVRSPAHFCESALAESRTRAPSQTAIQARVGPHVHPSVPTAGPPLAQPAREPAAPFHRKAPDEIPRDWGTGVVTRMGGVLYLIHLLRKAELARHFETGLSGWALLELLARCLLGDSFPAVSADPIWEALAELDGRDPRAPPGRQFEPQLTYTAPDSWLRHLDPDTRLARFRSRGIELWTPEAVLVLDSTEPRVVAAHCTPIRIPWTERRRFRRAAEVHPADLPLSPELRRFLHFVLPYARWRLGQVLRAISLEDALARRGKLIVCRCHIDLVMDMNQISVPVRLAGLDANPGWAPELGRIVTFHFIPEGVGGD